MKVVYNSFGGRYSDNTRSIYEFVTARGHAATHIWLFHPAHRSTFPDGAELVEFGTERCIEELESADLVISNTHIELDWNKSADTVYLQTWHGTPLKHIHFDSLWAPPGRVAYLTEDVRRWDYLLSPNRASTELLRGAFGFTGEILETGYPRNDVLSSAHREEIRTRVRDELGIPAHATLVLYTPTWRDNLLDAQGRQDFSLQLDLDAFTRELGRDFYLLLRTHFLVSAERPAIDRPTVRDVSAHPEVSELYLAADVMITDYSSTMFDFAITGKPLLFYTYDLAHYRDTLRGFYFDLHEHAPGPILQTSDEVIEALRDLPSVQTRSAPLYTAFRERYGHLDDGGATARVVSRFFPEIQSVTVGPATHAREGTG
jgi:CDP-glycerol glycerophosphotransferase